ncbi:DUF1761 domain-containing protein [Candidatus Giovannonibacteria bacterium]|nr:DUF1761 domain-containing protein [Candidatus Giovannonibacteria bacterium]
MPQFDVNFTAVLVAAIVSMIAGMVWYNPKLFGKSWMEGMGFTPDYMNKQQERGMGKYYFMSFIGSILTAYILAYFIKVLVAVDFFGAFQTAFWIWLGFIATTLFGQILWDGKTAKVYFINAGYQLVNLFAMALVLVFWPW